MYIHVLREDLVGNIWTSTAGFRLELGSNVYDGCIKWSMGGWRGQFLFLLKLILVASWHYFFSSSVSCHTYSHPQGHGLQGRKVSLCFSVFSCFFFLCFISIFLKENSFLQTPQSKDKLHDFVCFLSSLIEGNSLWHYSHVYRVWLSCFSFICLCRFRLRVKVVSHWSHE